MNCDDFQHCLDETAFARTLATETCGSAPEATREALAHARSCGQCGAHLAFLHALDSELAVLPLAPVRASIVASAEQRAARALRARERPHGFGREVAAALAVAVLAFPLVVAQAFVVVESGAWLLASWVPGPILTGLGVGYLASFALGVGALYGSIPLVVAWRRRARLEWA